MPEKYTLEQGVANKLVTKILNSGNYNHAYLIETNGYNFGYKFALDFIKQIYMHTDNFTYENISTVIDENNFSEFSIIRPDGIWIKKEQIIDLQKEFNKMPVFASKKIYLVTDADKLNASTSNAILKFLEEPAEDIIAILLCDNRFKLLDTIISRCQIIALSNQTLNKEESVIIKIGQSIIQNAVDRDTFIKDENSIEIVKGVIEFLKYFEINKLKTILYINKYWFKNFPNKEVTMLALNIAVIFYRDVMNYMIDNEIKIFKDEENVIKKIAHINTISVIGQKISCIVNSIEKIECNANLSLAIDKLIIEMERCV